MKFAKKAAWHSSQIIFNAASLAVKALIAFVLILVTTGMMFACIFVVYVKTSLSDQLEVNMDEIALNLTSSLYYYNEETEKYEKLVDLQGKEDRVWVDYEQIPKYVEQAVVAIEDKRFYQHNGVDWYRTIAAFVNMFATMRDNFGGSTITQQLIKNSTQEDDVTVQRKLLEILRALEFEKRYTKEEIVELYLNVVYFGHGCSGIQAAANYYFNKDVSELTVAEAAAIVGITNNPSMYSPKADRVENKRRQIDILYEMNAQGYITDEEYTKALRQNLDFTFSTNTSTEVTIYSYFESAVIEDVIADIMEQRNVSYDIAEQILFSAGYKIYTTVDMDVQGAIELVYEDLSNVPTSYAPTTSQQLQSAIVITDPYTGAIVGLAGGVGEQTVSRGLNRATGTVRPAGSSIKPLAVYAPAMDLGLITPNTRLLDGPTVVLQGRTDGWLPKNDDRDYRGVIDVRTAICKSVNVISAQVLDMLTPQASFEFLMEDLGFTSPIEADMDYAPLSLGQFTYGITVREMAQGYGMFVNSGMRIEAHTYTSIYDANDELVYENIPEAVAAISEATAYWMADILTDATYYGTGTEARLHDMTTAGKTGTTDNNQDRWYVGFTPYYVCAVWSGYDTPSKMNFYGNPSAQLWHKVMELVHEDLPNRSFNVPADTYQTPVPGIDFVRYPYTVRGVTTTGQVLYEYTEEADVYVETKVYAQVLPGYKLIGDDNVKIRLEMAVNEETGEPAEPKETIVEFVYEAEVIIPPVIDDPTIPVDPNDPLNPPASPSISIPDFPWYN